MTLPSDPPPRWIATWPYDLQPIPGSSTIDWTKVSVVPAAYYDAAIVDATEYENLVAERDKLRAECEGLRRDAGRYKWICSNALAIDLSGDPDNFIRVWTHTCAYGEGYHGKTLDAAIDSVKSEGEKP